MIYCNGIHLFLAWPPFLAMSLRCWAVSFAALAGPPALPPADPTVLAFEDEEVFGLLLGAFMENSFKDLIGTGLCQPRWLKCNGTWKST